MLAPTIAAADIVAAYQRLLPRGRIWSRSPNSTVARVLGLLAPTYARQIGRQNNLLTDAFPATTTELISEWESTLGLPDPCAGPSPALQVRQQQVLARFVAQGRQSVAYYTSVAAALGYTITITQFAPFRVGQTVGQPIYGDAWAHAWQVNAPAITVNAFRVGIDTVGEPLAQWGNTVLQCELQRLAPAHTVLLFSYS